MSREVVIVSGVRTAIGTYGGSLKNSTPLNTFRVAEETQFNHKSFD